MFDKVIEMAIKSVPREIWEKCETHLKSMADDQRSMREMMADNSKKLDLLLEHSKGK